VATNASERRCRCGQLFDRSRHPSLIGRDARKIEDSWQYFCKGAYWRRGPVTMSAISAVDTALWDLKAKA